MLLSDKVKRSHLLFPEKEKAERYIVSLPFGLEKKDRVIDGVVKGQNLQNLFSDLTIGYHDSVDFNSFLIPFACVAVDMVSGRLCIPQRQPSACHACQYGDSGGVYPCPAGQYGACRWRVEQ
jgi:hypothetical protein